MNSKKYTQTKLYKNLLLIAILVTAFAVRLVGISNNPPSLYWEEAALGYDAYSITKTGKDYHGNIFPIVSFSSFGDYKPSLYFYAAVPFIATFGLGEMAVRLPSVVAGLLAVLAVYLISKELKFSRRVSLLSALLLSISPWHIQFSRAAFEVNLGTTIYLFGIWLLLLSRKKHFHLLSSAALLSLSMYAYHGFRVIAPISALVIYIFYIKSFKLKKILPAFILAVLISLPLIGNINNPSVNQRLKETSHFSQSRAVQITNKLRADSGNTLLSRVIFHRYWWWAGELAQNYMTNFSPNFLFLTGDNNPRHGVGEFGPLYHWELITISFGLLLLLRSKSKDHKLILLLLGVVPLATMITKTNPHTLRMLPAAPYFSIISAFGLSSLIKGRKLVVKVVFGAVILGSFLTFSHFYFRHYPKISAGSWQYGYKQVFSYISSLEKKYDHIYVTREYGRPSIYALFYMSIDPSHIQEQEPSLKKDQLELLEFDNFVFGSNPPISDNSLYVLSPKESVSGLDQLYKIDFPNGESAFSIYEKN